MQAMNASRYTSLIKSIHEAENLPVAFIESCGLPEVTVFIYSDNSVSPCPADRYTNAFTSSHFNFDSLSNPYNG
jgi:hypothetical protein